jgi:hypothetical protein
VRGQQSLLAPTIKEVAMIKRKEISKEEILMIQRIEPSREEITHGAYRLYLQRGGEQGREVEDWLRAEKELSSAVVVRAVRANVSLVTPN